MLTSKQPKKRVASMSASAAGPNELCMLLTGPNGNCYVQIAAKYWVMLDPDTGWLLLDESAAKASALKLGGNPAGSTWQVYDGTNWKDISYGGDRSILNINEGTSGSFTPTVVTPSLTVIQSSKTARGYDLRGAPLTNADFTGVDASSADFTDADLTGATFTKATLAKTVLRNAILAKSTFREADLDQADLSGAKLDGACWGAPKQARSIILTKCSAVGATLGGQPTPLDCTGANLAGADLRGANLSGLVLNQATLAGAFLADANLDKTKLDGAVLTDVIAPGASLRSASLQDIRGEGACLAHADLTDADLSRAQLGSRTFLFQIAESFKSDLDTKPYPQKALQDEFKKHSAQLKPESPVAVVRSGARWRITDPAGPYDLVFRSGGIDVFRSTQRQRPAVLRGAVCRRTKATKAVLVGADLRGIAWFGAPATLAHADLEDASLAGGLLASLDLSQAQLSGADLSATVLVQAKLRGSTLGQGASHRPCSLEGALLLGTDFTEAKFTAVLLLDAAVALDLGVPLFELAPNDKQHLTQSGIGQLAPKFAAAGHPLGNSPQLISRQGWKLNNGACTDPGAPRSYRVRQAGANLNVYADAETSPRFGIPASKKHLLNGTKASPALVQEFSQNGCKLVKDAPITAESGYEVTPDASATPLARATYTSLRIHPEPDGSLPVYGSPLVKLRDWTNQIGEFSFGTTTNLDKALDAESVAPNGFPISASKNNAWLTLRLLFTARSTALR
ncbi:pentapeptide repeat-containing protein [Saccharopolyspora sp. 5N708]|uniref:pentapeptide repeat-containing protein n=1 Tax=Saccharopolyspora sp. 5N708 TaxID=3457424 RepID=UPI003FD019F0